MQGFSLKIVVEPMSENLVIITKLGNIYHVWSQAVYVVGRSSEMQLQGSVQLISIA